MLPRLASAALPLLHRMGPEPAHRLALTALRLGLAGRAPPPDPILATSCLGLQFESPIGLAAGFDKDAAAPCRLLAAGFGFVELGTVTPLPQPGNPRPRLFRLPQDRAIINRMGFNGAGADRMERRLRRLPPRTRPIGINLGVNKQGAHPPQDYANLVRRFAPLADYLVINVSSPNTPGLRDLQAEHLLAEILAAIPPVPPALLVKLAPDLAAEALPAIIETCIAHGVDGIVISNTTIARPETLAGEHAHEPGGLSGAPLFAPSTAMLAHAYRIARGRLDLIGVGGIATAAQAFAKIKAGASLVQLYTAYAYEGPALVIRMQAELAALLRAEGYNCLRDAIGIAAASSST